MKRSKQWRKADSVIALMDIIDAAASDKLVIHMCNGNSKIGYSIKSVSFMPFTSCNRAAGCAKKGECYANKFTFRATVARAWYENERLYRVNPKSFWTQLQAKMSKRIKFLRFFVSGDFIRKAMVTELIDFARANPGIKMLAFTKRYQWLPDIKVLPGNLSIVVSAWPGLELPVSTKGYPIAFLSDDTRVKRALNCPGNCDSCGACWDLRKFKLNVAFDRH